MGPECGTVGLPSSVGRKETLFGQGPSRLPPTKRSSRKSGFGRGGCHALVKRCNRASNSSRQPRLLLPSVHGQESLWGFSSGFEPVTTQCVPPSHPFSHGYGRCDSEVVAPRRLGSLSGSERCLLSCGDTSTRQKVASFPLGGSEFPVSCSPFRSQSIPMDFHHSCESPGCVGSPASHSNECIYRRLADSSPFTRDLPDALEGSHYSGRILGLHDQLPEVRSPAFPEIHFSGNGIQHCRLDSQTERETADFFVEENSGSFSGVCGTGQIDSVAAGDHGVDDRPAAFGKPAQAPPAEGFCRQVQAEFAGLDHSHSSRSVVYRSGATVDCTELAFEVHANPSSRACRGNLCGCFPTGVGRSHGAQDCLRTVESSAETLAHQQVGASSCVGSSVGVFGVSTARSSACSLRQHNSGVSDQSSRGFSCTSSVEKGGTNSTFRSGEGLELISSPFEGQPQYHGRPSQQTGTDHPNGVDSPSASFDSSLVSLGSTRDRPLCHSVQCQTTEVCLASSGQSGVGDRCVEFGLGQSVGIRISASSSHSISSLQGAKSECAAHSSGTLLAKSGLVSSARRSGSLSSCAVTSEASGSFSASVRDSTQESTESESARVAFVRRYLQGSGLSEEAMNLSLHNVRDSTSRVYDNHWSQWVNWCVDRAVDPGDPSASDLANHLAFLATESNLSLSTIKVRRTAVATTLAAVGKGSSLSQDKVIANIVRAIALKKAKVRVRVPAWDLLVVLSYLQSENFEPISASSLKNLTVKTAFLVALASGRRASEVLALSGLLGDLAFENDGSVTLQFLPEFLAKNQSPSEPSPVVSIKPLTTLVSSSEPDAKNCPVRALKIYRRRTRSIRSPDQRALFVSFNPNMKKDIKVNTLSRWFRNLILEAYLHWSGAHGSQDGVLPLRQPRAHEIRAWSSSLASRTSSLKSVLHAAFWRSEDVFVNFYLRDVARRRDNGLWGLPSVVAAQTQVPASSTV